MAKFIQFSKTANSIAYYNVDAIVKIVSWHDDNNDYEEMLTIYFPNNDPITIDGSNTHWTFFKSLVNGL